MVKAAAPEFVLDPHYTWPRDKADAWMVYLAAGKISLLPDLLPYPLPWVGMERDHVLRFWPAGRVNALVRVLS